MIEWSDLFFMGVFNAAIIFGINKATQFEYCHPDDNGMGFCDEHGIDKDSKMIGWKLRHLVGRLVGDFWSKPIFTCPPCMASIHGTWVYWLLMPFTIQSAILYPMYILFLSGLVSLINSVTKYGNS
jgi:hypothetical protein